MNPTHAAPRSRRAPAALLLAPLLAGCGLGSPDARAAPEQGRAAAADPGAQPAGQSPIELADPADNGGHSGRGPQRLSIAQLVAALEQATGHTLEGHATIFDPEVPGGWRTEEHADLLALLGSTLGVPDYFVNTQEVLDPTVSFMKIAADAARYACRAAVQDDLAQPDASQRRILRYAAPTDTAAASPEAVRRNVAYLGLRFWQREIAPGDAQGDQLVQLFSIASTDGAATPADGWRAVCIALATDPQFLTF